MANIAYVTFTVECSDAERLIKALIEKELIQDIDGNIEGGEFAGCLILDTFTTGYNCICNISYSCEEIVFEGGAKSEGWFSSDDLDMLKEVCAANDIELSRVESKWHDEFMEYFGVQAWPIPKWIIDKDPNAYADGFAYAHPNEDYEDSIAFNEDDDEDYDRYVFAEEFCQMLLEAMMTGKDPGFDEKWKKWVPHCIVYDYSYKEDDLNCNETFEWDWTSEED